MALKFDPELFKSSSTETSLATKYDPVPVGDYEAMVDGIDSRVVNTSQGESALLEITWEISAGDDLKKRLNRDKVTVRQGIFLDLDDNGALAAGPNKNIQLGRVREALGQNQPGKRWSPQDLLGGRAMLSIDHEPDKKDPETIYDRVKRVYKLGGGAAATPSAA